MFMQPASWNGQMSCPEPRKCRANAHHSAEGPECGRDAPLEP